MLEKIHSCLFCRNELSILDEGIFDTRFGVEGFFNICQCESCGLIQLSPCPPADELKQLYETYYNFGGSKKGLYTKLRKAFLESVFYRVWMAIDGDICFHSRRGQGRLLDIGCNEGQGLQIYKQNGFTAEGLELNERAASEAGKRGFRVFTDPLETFHPEQLYDVVVLSHVLEHSVNPREMLTHAARILKPDGQIWISCPNIESWQRGTFGRYWINWHVPFHIVHFSPEVLIKLLKDAGFHIINMRQETPALWVTHTMISALFARYGLPTRQLRSTFIIAPWMLIVRFFFFPFLFLGNKMGKGDCLVLIAEKYQGK
ncbi:class I SAM-dependent methyltransferase [Desulfobacterales bacterium HSG2]|nr:class I SAM-dependent methyltransferase [Desulfobacterales bacterium HSG2]